MKKKVFSIIFMIFCIIFLLQIRVNASIISTDKEVNSGDGNVTITVTSTQLLGSYKLEIIDTAGLELVSASGGEVSVDNKTITSSSSQGITTLGSFTFKVPTVSQDTTYNIKFHASIMLSPNLEPFDDEDNTAILTVRAKVEEPQTPTTDPEQPSTPNKPEQPAEQEKSSEARLVDFGIRPKKYDFDNFKPDDYENSVEVPNDVKNIEVYAKTLDSKATIQSGTGNVELKEGLNKVEVVVVAEDGKTKHTYTLNITRLSAETPATEPTTATTEPTTSTTSTEATNVDEFGLSSLTIAGLNINPKFSTTTYEYTAGLTEDLTTLEIEAKANTETGVVEIFGNENLQQGENTITIVVSDTADAEKSATYQITINKNYVPKTVDEVSWLNPSTWQLKQYIIIGTLIVLIIIVIVAIVLKVKLSRMDEEDEIEFPGVEELDKALTEHQELTNFDENKENQDNNFSKKNKKLFEDEEENDEQDKNTSTREKVRRLFDEEENVNTSKKKGKHF